MAASIGNMKEPRIQLFSKGTVAATVGASFLSRLARGNLAREILFIRALRQGDGFSRTLKCVPGSVTVIPSVLSRDLVAYLEEDEPSPTAPVVALRYGTDPLHKSEIAYVPRGDRFFSAGTVEAALRQAGAAETEIASVLQKLGLESFSSTPTLILPDDAARRLAVGCALFSKSKVLCFDQPFAGIEAERFASLSAFMLECAEHTSQIYLICGMEKIPPKWRGHARVRDYLSENSLFASLSKFLPAIDAPLPKADAEPNQVWENEDVVITTPQRLFRPRIVPETVKSESITNPNAEGKPGASAAEAASEVSPVSRSRRDNSLTKVSTSFRIWRKVKERSPKFWLKKYFDRTANARVQMGALLPEKKLLFARKNERIRIIVETILIVLVVVLLALNSMR